MPRNHAILIQGYWQFWPLLFSIPIRISSKIFLLPKIYLQLQEYWHFLRLDLFDEHLSGKAIDYVLKQFSLQRADALIMRGNAFHQLIQALLHDCLLTVAVH